VFAGCKPSIAIPSSNDNFSKVMVIQPAVNRAWLVFDTNPQLQGQSFLSPSSCSNYFEPKPCLCVQFKTKKAKLQNRKHMDWLATDSCAELIRLCEKVFVEHGWHLEHQTH
jgi:hypothetical protein